jgi:nickel transport system ATP-binding protein
VSRVLTVSGLHLAAGARALVQGVSLSLRRGQVLAMLGRSGGGKSLTTLALLDLLPAGVSRLGGEVSLDGMVLDRAGQAALRGATLGYVQQAPRAGFNPLVSIGRHFEETLAREGLRGGAARRRMLELLRDVGFEAPDSVPRLYPSQLSGGMLQRAMIALTLCRNPAFLLADEPTTDLDLVVQAQILDLLDRLVAERGIGLLLVTHDLSVVARLADEVAVMEDGTIVEQQPVRSFFDTPRHPRSRALLAAHRALYES